MSTADAQQQLREKLKVALQDARKLYDDGLLDENEFKDLKAHELEKYKEQLAAITAPSKPLNSHQTPPPPSATTPTRTPLNVRFRKQALASPASAPSYLSPPSHIRPRFAREDVLYVDSSTFQRLTTPPIFRRRPKKRRIVVPSEELRKLQQPLQPDGKDSV
ncbi:hypothetical protein BWQ96_00590 [Gracilariopsis chorda]|uniref:Uncharacterized protein n=1 Tax=Gracilariopsis chorda TaxID=448386 RepID=A0A2V3J9A3_9FLOR|nr:hypothetical protein BWQ96_00590 [Gracilariopsis chorda]|eukprot:PXF49520.1 hypothetical protein BWQ96_00590 [Gracilariopsis chorda]